MPGSTTSAAPDGSGGDDYRRSGWSPEGYDPRIANPAGVLPLLVYGTSHVPMATVPVSVVLKPVSPVYARQSESSTSGMRTAPCTYAPPRISLAASAASCTGMSSGTSTPLARCRT
jgi:hypothetical protein